MDDDELNVPEQIGVTLARVNAVIDTVWTDDDEDDEPDDNKQLYFTSREKLIDLQNRLKRGLVVPEYAEVELEKIRKALHAGLHDDRGNDDLDDA
jgi:hypothetical protein